MPSWAPFTHLARLWTFLFPRPLSTSPLSSRQCSALSTPSVCLHTLLPPHLSLIPPTSPVAPMSEPYSIIKPVGFTIASCGYCGSDNSAHVYGAFAYKLTCKVSLEMPPLSFVLLHSVSSSCLSPLVKDRFWGWSSPTDSAQRRVERRTICDLFISWALPIPIPRGRLQRAKETEGREGRG